MTEQKNSSHILSIDVNSHLKKLAANYFTSPSHYIVELVRCALYRGATRVNIDIRKGYVSIADNGKGIRPHLIDSLSDLLDPVQSMDTREQCIEDLKLVNGIGLVAIFSPSPSQIKIDNNWDHSGTTIIIMDEKLSKTKTTDPKPGTTISIKRNTGNFKDDIQYILNYCVFCQFEIYLNGKRIPVRKTFPNMLVSLELHNEEKAWIGSIGIPRSGDTCGIFYLDHGLIWKRKILPPENGFIYHTAVEWGEQSTDALNHRLNHASRSLYLHLAKNYLNYPVPVQNRVNEIIFKHHIISSDTEILDHWTPFQILGESTYYSYAQIRKKSETENLYAIPSDENPSLFPTENRTVLLLDNQQTDFLVNQKKHILTFLSPFKKRMRFAQLKNAVSSIFNKIKCLLGTLCFAKKIINTNLLTSREIQFLSSLDDFFNQQNNHLPGNQSPDYRIECLLYSAKYFMYYTKKKKDTVKLYINRNHPRIKGALKLIQEDIRNTEVIASLFTIV